MSHTAEELNYMDIFLASLQSAIASLYLLVIHITLLPRLHSYTIHDLVNVEF